MSVDFCFVSSLMKIILLLVLDIVASSVIMIVIVCGGGVSGNKAHNKKTLWATLCLFRLYIALLSFIIPQRIVYLYDCNIPSYYWILSQPTYFSYKNN